MRDDKPEVVAATPESTTPIYHEAHESWDLRRRVMLSQGNKLVDYGSCRIAYFDWDREHSCYVRVEVDRD